MSSSLDLRRKLTFQAHGRKVIFIKKPVEHMRHVIMKALLWAIYLPDYPRLGIEIAIEKRYKPDLVELDDNGAPRFWGEAGKVGVKKMRTLVQHYRHTHIAFAKWDSRLTPFEKIINKAQVDRQRTAPVDLISFPGDSENRFIDAGGRIEVRLRDVAHFRFTAAGALGGQT